MDNFPTSLRYVLKDEGGNSDDPHDHGGRTSRGVTQKEYNIWCANHDKPRGDVYRATDDDISTIYFEQYWMPYCPDMPNGVDYLFFDISVNAGRTAAVRQFQKALGLQVDGMMGLVTKSAIDNEDPVELINKVSDVRRDFYKHLTQFSRYGKGWMSRVDHSEHAAVALANRIVDHDKTSAPSGKATEPSKPSVSPETGGFLAAITAALTQFKEEIQSVVGSIPHLEYMLLGTASGLVGLTLYGIYRRYKIAKATS